MGFFVKEINASMAYMEYCYSSEASEGEEVASSVFVSIICNLAKCVPLAMVLFILKIG